jgi:hypothetical protein
MDTPPRVTAALSDRYLIEREIGAGGMALVYLARDRKLDREVALKVLRAELGAVLGAERFLAEIKISARLDHPHILTLIDSGDADGMLFYVLPYVRGESLRAKLDRERQLSLDEALAITKQVAGALDYAHRQGLVHRDIKPENILLQEGEAMLTDFGIALAVKEAGGNRLTQTGLSLGTPQYMSPEQATRDRGIDARSDVYSLASVLYEMLAGEPPVTGANAQAMIAKLMTERPARVRVLRDTVPEAVDAAIAKALAKTPADRFGSAGEFSRALELGASHAATVERAARPRVRRLTLIALGIAVVIAAAIVAGGAYMMRGRSSQADAAAVLGQSSQLTTSGAVIAPAVSPDGKQLAYSTKHCAQGSCTYSVVVEDVGGSTTRTILESAEATDGLEWSPDRRNLILTGTLGGRTGAYLLSALGGKPRFLTGGAATFFADGDSLLIGPEFHPDSVFWLGVAGIDAIVRDSIRVPGPGQALTTLSVMPGTGWILSLVIQYPHGLWQVLDRRGKVADRLVNDCTCGGIATSDAIWLARSGAAIGESIVRIALDRTTGRLAARQDTMATGLFTSFSLTSDGARMVMDHGTYDYNVWALGMSDLLKGNFPEDRRILHASTRVGAVVSPDGARLRVARSVPDASGRGEPRFSFMPFEGGTETPLGMANIIDLRWVDSTSVSIARQTPGGLHLAVRNILTNTMSNALDIPDSVTLSVSPLANGWAWIPPSADRVVVRQGARTREFPKPAGYVVLYEIAVDEARQRVFYVGPRQSAVDSVSVGVIDLAHGSMTPWATLAGVGTELTVLSDGAILLALESKPESYIFYRLTGPGHVERVGTSPLLARAVSVSRDMKRATVTTRDYHADAWMSDVITR